MSTTVQVVGGLGNATDSDVLSGVTYTSDNGIKSTGTFSPTAENISYDNTTSGLTSATVQAAIDEIASNGTISEGFVSYATTQTLTDDQKAQARDNIGVTQSDWNQDDTTASDYIKNRPFYGEDTETLLYSGTETCGEGPFEGDPYEIMFGVTDSSKIVQNDTFKLVINNQIGYGTWPAPGGSSGDITFGDYVVSLSAANDVNENYTGTIVIQSEEDLGTVQIELYSVTQGLVKIDSKYLPLTTVPNGGTGTGSFTAGYALIGNGTNAITTREILNNTATSSSITGTSLTTGNTLKNALNRTTSVAAANTSYTTYMARGIALVTTAPTSLTNGTIALVYT